LPQISQHPLFVRKSVIEYPKTKPSADALGEVRADDNHHYYVKGDCNGIPTRASEWLTTHLAEAVWIAAPAAVSIEMQDGSIVFGSRRVAGVSDDMATAAYLTTPTLSNLGNQPVFGLAQVLSSIYAFDMFVFNDDRHFGNYLSYDDNGVRRLLAFDFSRALFWAWPWAGYPLPNQNTRTHGGVLRRFHGFDPTAALTTLERLVAVPASSLEGFVNLMPSDWLGSDLRDQFLSWWDGSDLEARGLELRKGLSDGTLL
jgi:hypothetical protein